ncbi:MAG: hypothetical protein RIC89_19760 [Pseudomonadales bacterium]
MLEDLYALLTIQTSHKQSAKVCTSGMELLMYEDSPMGLGALEALLRKYVARRFSGHSGEDIVAETLTRVWSHDQAQRGELSEPSDEELSMSAVDATRLAYTIARGLIADHYRKSARRWFADRQYAELEHGESSNLEDEVSARELLLISMEILANSSKDDRAALGVYLRADNEPIDAKTRQRVSRLRRRLKHEIQKRVDFPVTPSNSESTKKER